MLSSPFILLYSFARHTTVVDYGLIVGPFWLEIAGTLTNAECSDLSAWSEYVAPLK